MSGLQHVFIQRPLRPIDIIDDMTGGSIGFDPTNQGERKARNLYQNLPKADRQRSG